MYLSSRQKSWIRNALVLTLLGIVFARCSVLQKAYNEARRELNKREGKIVNLKGNNYEVKVRIMLVD